MFKLAKYPQTQILPAIISLHAYMYNMKSHYSYHNVYISQIDLCFKKN
ncbi:Uncharacterised protein [Orientia tsutsugamushi]|uniref:Uncharacterized protein n=1 Tax=Orientia tsutsugamushi TaxID=784 RepID=A0A2U3RGE6_ORITS|nr:Uncharacterised protein [Orientia tsutsugamushi]